MTELAIHSPPPAAVRSLTWGLVVATYERADVLVESVGYALRQSRPPAEVVVCDSSADWEETARRVEELVGRERPGVRVSYQPSDVARQTYQRNVAIGNATADVLFMIDDDSFLVRDAAASVMRVYESDAEHRVAAVGIGAMLKWVGFDPGAGGAEAELHVRSSARGFGRVFNRLTVASIFTRPRADLSGLPAEVRELKVRPIDFIEGFQFTVRREVADRLRFDANLVFNWFEDADASYRFGEAGAVVTLEEPLLYHAAAPRVAVDARRGVLSRFGWIMNNAYLQRKHFGGGPYSRFVCLTHLLRWLPFDLALGLARRDLSRFRGCLKAFRPVWRLTTAPQSAIGTVLVRETAEMKRRLSGRGDAGVGEGGVRQAAGVAVAVSAPTGRRS